jgi:asparagine synthase (glutamine-hydrolysing)
MEGMRAEFISEDRNAASASLTLRFPFLDYRLAEALWSMPITYKVRKAARKAIMRDALKDVLPEKVYSRTSKFGFPTNEYTWMNENVDLIQREFTKACSILSPIIHADEALSWFEVNKGKMQPSDFRVWRIICAGRWAALFEVKL